MKRIIEDKHIIINIYTLFLENKKTADKLNFLNNSYDTLIDL